MSDRIEKSIEMNAPVDRVWRALTDHVEFGQWFGVRLDGPFQIGDEATGRITIPGYDHLPWRARIVRMEAPRVFAFTWHPTQSSPMWTTQGRPRPRWSSHCSRSTPARG